MGWARTCRRFSSAELVAQFLRIELLVGLIGGLMPAALFGGSNARHGMGPFRFALCALVLVVGTLVGLEIPLVMRILKRHFRDVALEGPGVAGADLRLPGRAGGSRSPSRCCWCRTWG